MNNDPLASVNNTKQKSNQTNERKKIEIQGAATANKKMKMRKNTFSAADYLDDGNEVFLRMLSTAFSSLEYFQRVANEGDPIKFIHKYVLLISRECSLALQVCQCEYYHRIGTTDNI